MKFRPLHDRVVVRRVEDDVKTTGGIIIPNTAKEKPMQGEGIAVGPGARDESGKIAPLDARKTRVRRALASIRDGADFPSGPGKSGTNGKVETWGGGCR